MVVCIVYLEYASLIPLDLIQLGKSLVRFQHLISLYRVIQIFYSVHALYILCVPQVEVFQVAN